VSAGIDGAPAPESTAGRIVGARPVLFVIDDDARKLIYDKVPTSVLRARAREMGMRTLREDGIRKVLAGLTTPEEVIRATVGDET